MPVAVFSGATTSDWVGASVIVVIGMFLLSRSDPERWWRRRTWVQLAVIFSLVLVAGALLSRAGLGGPGGITPGDLPVPPR